MFNWRQGRVRGALNERLLPNADLSRLRLTISRPKSFPVSGSLWCPGGLTMATSAQMFLLPVFCLPLGLIGGCQMKQTSASEKTKVVWGKQAEGLRCALTVP